MPPDGIDRAAPGPEDGTETGAAIGVSDASGVAGLAETPVLGADTIRVGAAAIAFPRETDALFPITLGAHPLEVPRFSLFRGADVGINGFRLLSSRGALATDASLVMGSGEAEAFARKIAAGADENIDRAALAGHPAHPPVVLDAGPTLLACSDEPSNFGSWMYRILPKILLSLPRCGAGAILVYQQPWMTRLLESLRLGVALVHHEPTRQYVVPDAVIPSLPAPHAFLRPEARAALLGLHDRLPGGRGLGDRIYVSRRAQALRRPGFRVLENETELMERLRVRGFEEFIPEEHDFADQISILDRARVIVGCGGSNMFGCLFARRAELIVDIESRDDWLFAHRNVLASTGAPFTMVRGAQLERGGEPHRNWRVDAAALVDGLRALGVA